MSDIDMSAFEAEFSEERLSLNMDNVMFEKYRDLIERISDLTELNDMRRGMARHAQNEVDRYQLLLKRVEELAKRLRDKRDPFIVERDQLKREVTRDESKISTLERELARLLDEIAAQQRLKAERDLIDKKTEDAAWREFALPHQVHGAHIFASAERAICGDQMGLGKTLEAIMTIDLLRAKGKARKVLIFTPKTVVQKFAREIKRWSPGNVVHVLDHAGRGVKTTVLDMIQYIPEIIVVTNYEVWRKDASIREKMKTCQFDMLILDEAHKIGNADTGVSKGIRDIVYAENKCPKCGDARVIHRAYDMFCGGCEYEAVKAGEFCSIQQTLLLTGTAVRHKPQDIFPLLNIVDREGFPKENFFLQDFCERKRDEETDKVYWTFRSGGEKRLFAKLGMKYLGRDRDSAGVIMPPQEVIDHYLELTPEDYPRQHAFVTELREKAVIAFSDSEDDKMTQNGVLAWYTRMRQAASWPDGIEIRACTHEPMCTDEFGEPRCEKPEVVFPRPGMPKIDESVMLDKAEELVTDALDNGHRIVVFCQFRAEIDELEHRLLSKKIRAAKLVGGLPDSKRQEIVDDFDATVTPKNRCKYDVLIAQIRTASEGLNMHGAQQMVIIDRPWSPQDEKQMRDRLRRLDSVDDSIVHRLHVPGTFTDVIDLINDLKEKMLGGFEAQAEVNLKQVMKDWLKGEGDNK